MKRVLVSAGVMSVFVLVLGLHFALQRYEFHPVGSSGRHVLVCDRLTGKAEKKETAYVALTDAERWKVVSERPTGTGEDAKLTPAGPPVPLPSSGSTPDNAWKVVEKRPAGTKSASKEGTP
jgi:hypothetical protein